MKKKINLLLAGFLTPLTVFAAGEGVPSYYQKNAANGSKYTTYVGNSGQKQVVGSRTYNYRVPVQNNSYVQKTGQMTPNGIAVPVEDEKKTTIYGGYARRFADFEFETGVNSVLEWDDMVFNEFTAGLSHNFSLGSFDLNVFGEYTYGSMTSGGLSMDYDLKPYDAAYPEEGIFTISMGDQSGKSHHIKFGLSAHHVWDIGGWKLSPTIGYEIFKHNLEMSDHYYPNPGVYVPLLTNGGTYVFGNGKDYYSVPYGMTNEAIEMGLYQVCMSPEDIGLVPGGSSSIVPLSWSGGLVPYDSGMGYIPWGVGPNECVIIGGDGPIVVGGTTHIYETTWSGFYVGLEVEKQMTWSDKVRLYVQFGLPKYSSEGTWPNRTDWQQNPSFLDEGSNGAYSYEAELEYLLKLSDRLHLSLKVDTNYFHVGEIPGELYVAEYVDWLYDENGSIITDKDGVPQIDVQNAHTEYIPQSLKKAKWQSFGLHLGLNFAF